MTYSPDPPLVRGDGPESPEEVHVRLGLARVEERLLAEFGGGPRHDAAVRDALAVACSGFEGSAIRRFIPILVEREARRRLGGG